MRFFSFSSVYGHVDRVHWIVEMHHVMGASSQGGTATGYGFVLLWNMGRECCSSINR